MQRIFHTAEGVRDIYDGECRRKHALQEKIHEVFRRYGYQDIETPTFEFFEVFSSEVGTIPSRDLYKFFDREGNTLVLRPDFTPSVSRACATLLSPEISPVSLCYTGNTFVNNSGLRGRLKETTQMGVERIGDASADADAELLAMTAECLQAAGLRDFQISVGQVDYCKALLEEADVSLETELRLRELISQKNYFGVEEYVKEQKLEKHLAEAFTALPQMFGSADVLEKAASLTANPRALKAVRRLQEIYDILKIYGCEKYISFDFGMLSKYRYYTGVIFQAYTYGTGEPIIKGGRYDDLMQHFGKPAASIGFAIVIDSLMLALSGRKTETDPEPEVIEICCTPDSRREAIEKAVRLRHEGKTVSLVIRERKGPSDSVTDRSACAAEEEKA